MVDMQSGVADLILTSPPYFSSDTESLLREPIKQQQHVEQVRNELEQFAWSLAPVFREMERVLSSHGCLVLMTRDVRYGNLLLGPLGVHRTMAEELGFRLQTLVHWQSRFHSASRRYARNMPPKVGAFRVGDTETVLVFVRPGNSREEIDLTDLPDQEWPDCSEPLWRLPGTGNSRVHPYQMATSLARRLVGLYSSSGDLVVDPFAGSGTTLLVAAQMQRRGIGYEIDPNHVARARIRLAKKLGKQFDAGNA